MSREKQGSIWYDAKKKYLYGRITFEDPATGKRKMRSRRAPTGQKKEAREMIRALLTELAEEQAAAKEQAIHDGNKGPDDPARLRGESLTMRQLADYHRDLNLVPVVFDANGIKRAGLISWKDGRRKLEALLVHFGADTLVRSLTFARIAEFKQRRLACQVEVIRYKRGADGLRAKDSRGRKTGELETVTRPLAVASVHRELAALSVMLNVAVDHEWIARNPMHTPRDGERRRRRLIVPSEEQKRETIATVDQEKALLEACADKQRAHLRPLLITFFDTGCRPIELARLEIEHVDFEANSFKVYSYKGTKRIDREYEMTRRVRAEFEKLCAGRELDQCQYVFTYTRGKNGARRQLLSVKNSFDSAKREAEFMNPGLTFAGFRLYDVRHTTMTRLIKKGMPLDEAGKLLGHTQPATTWRYNNPDSFSRKKAAHLLENYSEDHQVIPFPKRRRA